MEQGQRVHEDVVVGPAPRGHRGAGRGEQVGVGDGHALRGAGGARREGEDGDVAGPRLVADRHGIGLVSGLHEEVAQRRFVEDEPGAGEPGDAVPRGHGLGGVERHDRRAQPQDGEVGDHEGEGRPGDEHDGVTPADAAAPETCGSAPGVRVEPLVGEGVAVDLDRGAVADSSRGGLRGGRQRARGQVPEQRRRIARATEMPGPRPDGRPGPSAPPAVGPTVRPRRRARAAGRRPTPRRRRCRRSRCSGRCCRPSRRGCGRGWARARCRAGAGRS